MGSHVVTKQMLIDLERSLRKKETGALVEILERDTNATGFIKPRECREEAKKLVCTLRQISPDVPRGIGKINRRDDEPSDYWLGVVWAIADLDWKVGKSLARKWSQGSDRYTDTGFEKAWGDFDPKNTTHCEWIENIAMARII